MHIFYSSRVFYFHSYVPSSYFNSVFVVCCSWSTNIRFSLIAFCTLALQFLLHPLGAPCVCACVGVCVHVCGLLRLQIGEFIKFKLTLIKVYFAGWDAKQSYRGLKIINSIKVILKIILIGCTKHHQYFVS